MDTQKEPFSILLLDADGSASPKIREQFAENSVHPTNLDVIKSVSDAIEKLKNNHYHVILAHCASHANGNGNGNGIGLNEIFTEIHRRKLSTPVILMIDPDGETYARRALKTGATDYLIKSDEEIRKLPERLWAI